MLISFVPQDRDSPTCGHACVAMLLGLSLDDAIERIGRGPTNAPELVRALRRRFASVKLKRATSFETVPSRALVKLKGEGIWHWILRFDDYWFDPWGRRAVRRWAIGTWRVTGFVPLVRRGRRRTTLASATSRRLATRR